MKDGLIKKKSNWSAIEAAMAAAGGSDLPPSLFAAIADRLRGAIESPGEVGVEAAALLLEEFYRKLAADGPPALRDVVRGSAPADLARSYELGKIAFAQLFAARVAGNRADSRFFAMIEDPRYLPYLKLLANGPAHVSALREATGEALETVSRKLAILRELGLVASRKQGNRVSNVITPAALQTLADKGLWLKPADDAEEPKAGSEQNGSAQKARNALRDAQPDYLQSQQEFEVGLKARAA